MEFTQFAVLRTGLVSAVCIGTCLTTGLRAQAAFSHIDLGVHYGYNAGFDLNVAGAQVGVPIGRKFEFVPSLDRYWNVDGSQSALNADLKYPILSDRGTRFLIGTGLNVTRESGDGPASTDEGWNLLADIAPVIPGPVRPFAEFRVTVGRKNYQIVAGLSVRIPRH